MTRLILTFENLFKVLAADKLLSPRLRCRPTPTPPGLSSSICGMSLELLEHRDKEEALAILQDNSSPPTGVHEID